MSQTDVWMIGVVAVGILFYACTVYFHNHDTDD